MQYCNNSECPKSELCKRFSLINEQAITIKTVKVNGKEFCSHFLLTTADVKRAMRRR